MVVLNQSLENQKSKAIWTFNWRVWKYWLPNNERNIINLHNRISNKTGTSLSAEYVWQDLRYTILSRFIGRMVHGLLWTTIVPYVILVDKEQNIFRLFRYFVSHLTRHDSTIKETSTRMSSAPAAFAGPKHLWRQTHTSLNWNGCVYCATTTSVPLYGRGTRSLGAEKVRRL